MPPPFLRIAVLISAAVLLVGLAFVADDGRFLRAQTTPTTVDYDTDDDGLIEVSNANQWRAISDDVDGDGRVATASPTPFWISTGYPNAAEGAGCPLRDHDDDSTTAEISSCIGYELIADISPAAGIYVQGTYTAKLVGNGFRILNPNPGSSSVGGLFQTLQYSSTVEGVGVINPRVGDQGDSAHGGIVQRLEGKVIGSYVQGGDIRGDNAAGIAQVVTTHPTSGYGLIAHSYVQGAQIGDSVSGGHAGLAGTWEHQRGTSPVYRSTCLNSYASVTFVANTPLEEGIIGEINQNGQVRVLNCVGDRTTDDEPAFGTNNPSGDPYRFTKAQMTGVTDYDTPAGNPFAAWDDYPIDGSIEQLSANAPRTDVWDFGDETTFPVLKAWGHDRAMPLDRSQTGNDMVNLCTRTLAVANEIIRHLKDDVRRSGVTATPAAVTALTPCTSSSDTRNVSITNLTDLVVTNADHVFDLSPGRTFPESARLTDISRNDFAYLTNAMHFDLGGNDLEEIPPRLFQAIPLRWLDLSNNKLTTLPADLFADVAAVTDVGGNTLLLNGNTLTDTGIPDRIFDTMPHLNGLDLSDNNIARVNTRWFQELANLGNKPATNAPYTHALGLHLEGNTITEHFYSVKRFTGIRENVESYADVTSPTAMSAGDALRTAITAAITAAAGGTTPTTLSLTATDYYNTGASAAYTNTACPTSGTAGPGRYDYLGGVEPACYFQPHWTPPHKSADTATAAPSFTGTAASGTAISTQFSHTQTTTFVAYQTRYRHGGEPWSTWQVVPMQYSSGTKGGTVPAVWRGQAYTIEMRALSTAGPPSATVSQTANSQAADWITGFAAASGTAAGSIALSWNAPTGLPASNTVTAFYYRYKPQAETTYASGWRSVPDSSDTGTSPADETSHTITGLVADLAYDIQFVAGIDGPDADTTVDYFTNRYSDNATALGVPAGLSAAGGTIPGTIRVMWTMQTVGTTASSRLQVRRKLRSTANWPMASPFGWIDVPDSTGTGGDADTDAHNETEYTLTGLTTGAEYDVEVRLFRNTADGGPMSPTVTTATATAVAPPASLTAADGTFGNIVLTWTQQTVSSDASARYQVRWKKTSDDWPDTSPNGWTTLSTSTHASTTVNIGALEPNVSYDFEVRFLYSTAIGTSEASTVTRTTANVLSAVSSQRPGEIDLTWTGQTAATGSNARFQTRVTWATGGSWIAWSDVPDKDSDGDRHDETTHTIIGLTSYRLHHVEVRFHDGTTAGPVSRINNVRAGYQPRNLQASTGTVPGTIDVSWDQQSAITGQHRRFAVSAKLGTSNTWGGWVEPPNPGTNTHDETGLTLTGLTNGALHDVRAMFNSGPGQHDWPDVNYIPMLQNIRAGVVPPPQSLTAVTPTNAARAVTLSWDQQMESTETASHFEYRAKLATANTWPSAWSDVTDGSDANTHTYDETTVNVYSLTAGAEYDFQVRFHWDTTHGNSEIVTASATASDVPAPLNFAAVPGLQPGTVDLSWDVVWGINDLRYRYKLKSAPAYPTSGAGDWTAISDSGDSGSSAGDEIAITVTGLTAGSEYTFQIQARVTASDVSPSATTEATAQTQAPPRSVVFSQGTSAGQIGITWQAPSVGTPTGYQFRYKLNSATEYPNTWTNVPDADNDGDRADERAHTITNLWAGVSYDVQLRAEATIGPSLQSADTTGTVTSGTLAGPTGRSAATGVPAGSILIRWNALTAGLPTGDTVVNYQYRTRRSWPAHSPWTNWFDIPGPTTTSYQILGLTQGPHHIDLRAAIDDDADADSLADYYSQGVPAGIFIRARVTAPAGLTAATGTNPGEIALTWTSQSLWTHPAARYHFRAKLTTDSWPAGGGWTTIASSRYNSSAYTITGLKNNQRYDIELRLLAAIGIITATTSAQATSAALAQPTGFSAATSTTTSGAIDLKWTAQAAVTASTAAFQYRAKLEAASWPGTTPFGWTDIPDGADADSDAHNEIAYTITGLTADSGYDVELRFFMSTAVGGSAAVAATATASQVPVPAGFDATTGSGAGQINLSWTAVIGATDYQYRCVPAAPGCTNAWSSAGTGTSHTIPNLTGGAFYNVQLRARATGVGESAPTASQRAQAQTTPGPATLTFSHGTNPGDIKLDWTAPANNAPAEHFEYRYKLASASDSAYPATYTKVPDSDNDNDFSDETTITITGLQAGVSYHVQFRVFASSAIGHSLPQRGTQTARPVPPPTLFSAAMGTNPGEVSLSWTAPSGVTILRYELRHRLGTTGDWSSWTSAGTATSHTFTGLRAGMLRTFNLRAVMQTVGSSAPVATTGTPTAVPTPATLTATTGIFPGEIDLTWTAVTGATSYEYRLRLSSESWPTESNWESVSGTTTTLAMLDEGAPYVIELRAAITNVGMSTAVSAQATTRSATFTDDQDTPPIPATYSVSTTAFPGQVALQIPANSDPFIYRHRTANPGEWSRWFKVTPTSTQTQFLIPDLRPGVLYEIEVRVYTGPTTGFTTALEDDAQAAPLEAPDDFQATESSGVIVLMWTSPELFEPNSYEYRTRPTGTTEWGDWITVPHVGAINSPQRHYVSGLESGISHDFQLRMLTGTAYSPTADSSATARLRLAEVHSIKPVVREVSIRAGETIALTVDIYDTQEVLDNTIPDATGSKLIFRWTEQDSRGRPSASGGTFGTPNDERRVSYTAPSSPGLYTIQAEAQPDGVCTSHHRGAPAITATEREPCQAIFTIRVTAAPTVAPPRPDPVNPTGSIPTSMTDNQGVSYAVVTPADGGTFTGTDITITAPAAAIPDRTIIGISARVSDITPPAPIPGARMSVAGRYYEINALQESGDPPLQSYTLLEPARACVPLPPEFRANLSDVVMVQRATDGNLSILMTKIRSNAGALTVCGTLSRLPATVGVARLGIVPAATIPTPAPDQPLPDTGAPAPSATVAVLILLAGILSLTAISRIGRIIPSLSPSIPVKPQPAPAHPAPPAAPTVPHASPSGPAHSTPDCRTAPDPRSTGPASPNAR